jgi:hypothetical protein
MGAIALVQIGAVVAALVLLAANGQGASGMVGVAATVAGSETISGGIAEASPSSPVALDASPDVSSTPAESSSASPAGSPSASSASPGLPASSASAAASSSPPSSTSVPSPPATQKLAPTPAPTKAPTPQPTPVITPAGIAVPDSINSTGSSDASAALNTFLASVPDGSTIVFKKGGVYRMDHGLVFSNRHNLTFEGNGATLRANGSGSAGADSPFALWQGNDHIVIRNFTIIGNNPRPGHLTSEGQAGILLHGNSNVEIYRVTIENAWSDCVYAGITSSHVGVNGLSFHDSTCVGAGRMGVAITGGGNLTVQNVGFNGIGMHVFDIEPDFAGDSVSHVTFRNNTVGTYGVTTNWVGFLFAANGASGSTVSNVTVTGNKVSGNPHAGYDGKPRGINANLTTAGRSNIVFTNNSSTMTVPGPALSFAHINGLTVTGNVQPLSSGSLAHISDCTNVVYS